MGLMYYMMKSKRKMSRLFQKMLLTSKLVTMLSLIVTVSLISITVKRFRYISLDIVGNQIQSRSNFNIGESPLVILTLSKREAFDHRKTIRQTWAFGHNNVFFVVGESDTCIFDSCNPNNESLFRTRLEPYMDKDDMITRKILDEGDVIIVPTGDNFLGLQKKVTESYRWALQTVQAKWFLHVDDSVNVEVDNFENYLNSAGGAFENAVIMSAIKLKSDVMIGHKYGERKQLFGKFMCGLNHVVSKHIAQYAISGLNNIFEYKYLQNYDIKIIDSINFTSGNYRNLGIVSKDGCNITTTLQLNLSLKHNRSFICIDDTICKSKKKTDNTYSLIENPTNYLNTNRFDLVVKMVYAYFYVFKPEVPKVIEEAYKEHLRVWNNFIEHCNIIKEEWHDAKRLCVEKRGSSDFITAFRKTIDTIKRFGFNSTMSRIPVDKTGFLLNGAHRLAASVVLSKFPTFEHQNYEQHFPWGYEYFKRRGMSESTLNLVMLEWIKLQMELPLLKAIVSVISVFSNNPKKDGTMREIVKEMCSIDNGILYERSVKISKKGARQLIIHMYGQQSWLETKVQQMLSKFKSTTFKVVFLFVYGKPVKDLLQCKHQIRKLYNDEIFKSTVHIPDTVEENVMLAKMILNSNSLQFMNYAKDSSNCKNIAEEIARRSGTAPIKTLPNLYIGREDIMIDSGAVLGFFGLRKQTDVDILFLQDVDKLLLGNHHGSYIQVHAFKSNVISIERAWGEDHFSKNGPKDQWDLFYDHQNYGYCYGLKFVSLKQLVRYKSKRHEPKKDLNDVNLIHKLLTNISSTSS